MQKKLDIFADVMDMDRVLNILQGEGDLMPRTDDDEDVEDDEEEEVKILAPFCFTDAKDPVGLPYGHESYVKASCSSCYGRGYQIQLVGGRHYQNCHCVTRGYARARKRFDRECGVVMALYDLSEEKARKHVLDLFF